MLWDPSIASINSSLEESKAALIPNTGGSGDESSSSEIELVNFKGLDESLGEP